MIALPGNDYSYRVKNGCGASPQIKVNFVTSATLAKARLSRRRGR